MPTKILPSRVRTRQRSLYASASRPSAFLSEDDDDGANWGGGASGGAQSTTVSLSEARSVRARCANAGRKLTALWLRDWKTTGPLNVGGRSKTILPVSRTRQYSVRGLAGMG